MSQLFRFSLFAWCWRDVWVDKNICGFTREGPRLTSRHPIICNSSSRGFDALFWLSRAVGPYMVQKSLFSLNNALNSSAHSFYLHFGIIFSILCSCCEMLVLSSLHLSLTHRGRAERYARLTAAYWLTHGGTAERYSGLTAAYLINTQGQQNAILD